MRLPPIALLAAAALATPLAAQMPAEGGGRGQRTQTRDEAIARAREHFAALDLNHDGVVTREEAASAMQGGPDDGSPPSAGDGSPRMHGGGGGGMIAMMFDMVDTDHDGRITAAEADAAAAARFDRMDTNHDGVLTPEERRAGRGMMGRHDLPGG